MPAETVRYGESDATRRESPFAAFARALRAGVLKMMQEMRPPADPRAKDNNKFKSEASDSIFRAAVADTKREADEATKQKKDQFQTRIGWLGGQVDPDKPPQNKSRQEFVQTVVTAKDEEKDDPYFLLREGMRLNARTKWEDTSTGGNLHPAEKLNTKDTLEKTYERIHRLRQEMGKRGERFEVEDKVIREALGMEARTAVEGLVRPSDVTELQDAPEVLTRLQKFQDYIVEDYSGNPPLKDIDAEMAYLRDQEDEIKADPARNKPEVLNAIRIARRRLAQLRIHVEEQQPGNVAYRPARADAGGGDVRRDRYGRPDLSNAPFSPDRDSFVSVLDDLGSVDTPLAKAWIKRNIFGPELTEDERNQRRDLLKMKIRQRVREQLATLEGRSSTWREDTTFPGTDEGILNKWLILGQGLDAQGAGVGNNTDEFYENLHYEVLGRHWLHGVNIAIATGASPTDIKKFVEAMQDFMKMEYHEGIAKIPGLSKAFQLLEQNGRDLVRNEHIPERINAIREAMLQALRDDPDQLFNADGTANVELHPEMAGLTDKTVLEVARRMFKETGRDAWYYRDWIQSPGVIQYKRDAHGNMTATISEDAPLAWDGFRMAYSWEAMWTFFNIGGTMTGAPAGVKIARVNAIGFGIGAPQDDHLPKEYMNIGKGVGAEVRHALHHHGFSLNISDVFSRRKNMITEAWITEYSMHLDRVRGISEAERAELEWLAPAWEQGTSRGVNELGGSESDPGITARAKRKVFKAAMVERFTDKNGLPMYDTDIHDIEAEIAKVKDAATRARLTQALARAKTAVETKRNGSLEDMDGFFKDLSKFDISDIPFATIRRLQENFRGNIRDHAAALGVLDAVTKFINDPNIEAFQSIRYQQAIGYSGKEAIQAKMMLPVWYGFEEVHKVNTPLGKEWGIMKSILPKWFKSKYARINDVNSLSEHDLERLLDWEVAVGNMSHELRLAVLGGGTDRLHKIRGWIKLNVGRNLNPEIFWEVAILLLVAELQKLEKETGAGGSSSGGHGHGH